MAMQVVPEAVGEAMVSAFEANAAYAAEMAALQASEAEAGAGLAALEAELAAETAFETSLEAAEAMEAAGGPLGWIAMALTGGMVLATALAIVMLMDKIAQSNLTLNQIQKKIATLPKPPPLPTAPPSVPNTKAPVKVDPFIDAVFTTINSAPGVFDPYFRTCRYPYTSPHCSRLRKKS